MEADVKTPTTAWKSYGELLQQSGPLLLNLTECWIRLSTAQGRMLNEAQLALFSQIVSKYDRTAIAQGFDRAERLLKFLANPADLIEMIVEPQIEADLQWVLDGIERFGRNWTDRPDRWQPVVDANGIASERVKVPGEKAPGIPMPIVETLESLGAGSWQAGLRFMAGHPRLWKSEDEGNRARMTLEIEQAWKKAWMRRNL